MVTANEDDKIRIFDMNSGKVANQISAHNDAVTSVVSNQSGSTIFSVSHDGHIKVWDIRKLSCLADHEVN